MATVSEILSIAGKLSKVRVDAEEEIALVGVNRAYTRACLDCELTGSDATYTTTSTGSSIAASSVAGASVLRVQHIRLENSGVASPVQQVSRQELQDNLAVDNLSQGIPAMYSVSMVNGAVTIDMYPSFSSGDRIRMSYLATPPTLTTATTSIQYLPEMFHHDILTNAAVAILLERDGRFDDAAIWNARSLEGMTRLEEYLGQMGGTANRAYIAPSSSLPRFPDGRLR